MEKAILNLARLLIKLKEDDMFIDIYFETELVDIPHCVFKIRGINVNTLHYSDINVELIGFTDPIIYGDIDILDLYNKIQEYFMFTLVIKGEEEEDE